MTRNYQSGEQRYNAKLNPEKVRYILRNMDTKNASLASEMNVNEASIEHVKHRRCWAWVTLDVA